MVADGDSLTTLDIDNYTLVDTSESYPYYYLELGFSAAESKSRLFAYRSFSSYLFYVDVSATGQLLSADDAPSFGSFPAGTRTFVSKDETRVISNSGIIYNTSDLSYEGSMAGAFSDLEFVGDIAVAVRDGELMLYSSKLLPLTTAAVSIDTPVALTIKGYDVFVFGGDGFSYEAEKVPFADFAPPTTGPEIDPEGLAYTPTDFAYDTDDDVLWVFSANQGSLFGWSRNTESYAHSIPLWGTPTHVAFNDEDNLAFLGYDTGLVTKIDLDAADPQETAFAAMAYPVSELETAGRFLIVAELSSRDTLLTLSQEGSVISRIDQYDDIYQLVWNPDNYRMYYLDDDSYAREVIWREVDPFTGVIGSYKSSPYSCCDTLQGPLRVSPDGEVVVLGTGEVYGAISLVNLLNLPNSVVDADWHYEQMVTLRPSGINTMVQIWNRDFSLEQEFTVLGQPQRIFATGDDLIVVTDQAGTPQITSLDLAEMPDKDGDGIHNEYDNCPSVANYDQADSNNNGKGDVCEGLPPGC
ncbi:MAG: thrombospondin type 3 repeat-containing protein [Pseudomonadota bacterium]